ncbi:MULTISPECIES: autotransporter outer membrane beta-barrel domain-containing protein [unclassified Dyella]|uniref:autotransporter domain-containing protein n=1 Tax=Dyella sp. ASV21 TaxID=2795114 RepID=UPI0018EC2FAA
MNFVSKKVWNHSQRRVQGASEHAISGYSIASGVDERRSPTKHVLTLALASALAIGAGIASPNAFAQTVNPAVNYGTGSLGFVPERNQVKFPTIANTRNAKAAAAAVKSLGAGNAVYDALVVLDDFTAANGFDQLQDDIHASTRTAILENDRYVRDAIGAHLVGVASADGHAGTSQGGFNAWTSAWGRSGSYGSDGNAADVDTKGSGLVLGADLSVGNNARIGAVLGQGQGTARSDSPNTSAHHVDTYAGLYGDAKVGAVRVQGGAVYGWQKVNAARTVNFGAINDTANSRYNTHTAQAFIDASYEFTFDRDTIAPFLTVAYDRISTDDVHEQGSVAALNVSGNDAALTISTLGARGMFTLDERGGVRGTINVGWQHASGDITPVANARFTTGGDAFNVSGAPVAQNAAVVSGGVGIDLTPAVTIEGTYGGQFGGHMTDQYLRVGATWRF